MFDWLPQRHAFRVNTRLTTIIFCVVFSLLLIPTHIVYANFVFSFIADVFLNISLGLGGLFVLLGGLALNSAITNLIFEMGAWMLPTEPLGFAVNQVWTVIRDVFNLLFIFGLIYIGLKIIWDSDDSGAKRALGSLIIAALLINFSLYFSKAIVDFTNIGAAQIYTVMESNYAATVTGGTGIFREFIGLPASIGISDYFMQVLYVQSAGTAASLGEGVLSGTAGAFGYAVMLFFFLVFLGLLFLIGGILIIVRFIALVIYMMFSPFMFLGMIFPSFQSYTSQWWSGFLRYAFFAPAYLFMTYIALRVLISLNDALFAGAQNPGIAGAFGPDGDISDSIVSTTILFNIIALGFLVAAVVVAQKMSIAGSSSAMGAIKIARQKAQQALTYAPRAGARMATNKAGEWFAGKQNQRGIIGSLARTQTGNRLADQASNARFGTGTNRAEKRRHSQTMTAKVRTEDTMRNGLKAERRLRSGETLTDDQRLDLESQRDNMQRTAAGLSVSDLEGMSQERRLAVLPHASNATVKGILKSEKINPNDAAALSAHMQETTAQALGKQSDETMEEFVRRTQAYTGADKENLRRSVQNLSQAQLGHLGSQFLQQHGDLLSDSQFNEMPKNDAFTDSQVGRVRERRTQAIREMVTEGNQVLAGELAKLGDAQVEQLGEEFLLTNAHLLTEDHIKGLGNSKNINKAVVNQITQRRTNAFTNMMQHGSRSDFASMFKSQHKGGSGGVQLKDRKPTEIASLPVPVLRDPRSAQFINKQVLVELEKKNVLSPDDMNTLKANIRAAAGTSTQARQADNYMQSLPGRTAGW